MMRGKLRKEKRFPSFFFRFGSFFLIIICHDGVNSSIHFLRYSDGPTGTAKYKSFVAFDLLSAEACQLLDLILFQERFIHRLDHRDPSLTCLGLGSIDMKGSTFLINSTMDQIVIDVNDPRLEVLTLPELAMAFQDEDSFMTALDNHEDSLIE